jgi:hypothetical protein
MVTDDLIVVWLNNRPTLWRWDDAAEDFRYLRNLTEDERRLIESEHVSEVTEGRSVASAGRPLQKLAKNPLLIGRE